MDSNSVVLIVVLVVVALLLFGVVRMNGGGGSDQNDDFTPLLYDGQQCQQDGECCSAYCGQKPNVPYKECLTPEGSRCDVGSCNSNDPSDHPNICRDGDYTCARDSANTDAHKVCCPGGKSFYDGCTARWYCSDYLTQGEECRHDVQCKSGRCSNDGCISTGRCS